MRDLIKLLTVISVLLFVLALAGCGSRQTEDSAKLEADMVMLQSADGSFL